MHSCLKDMHSLIMKCNIYLKDEFEILNHLPIFSSDHHISCLRCSHPDCGSYPVRDSLLLLHNRYFLKQDVISNLAQFVVVLFIIDWYKKWLQDYKCPAFDLIVQERFEAGKFHGLSITMQFLRHFFGPTSTHNFAFTNATARFVTGKILHVGLGVIH